jgi:hypothetical protein
MTTESDAAGTEILQLVILLGVVAAFYFLIIPASVIDPDGYGMDQGLPPSFSPKLVAALAALLMLVRLGKLLLNRGAAVASSITDEEDDLSTGLPRRGLMGMAAALLFSQILIPVLGFYIASGLLLFGLLAVLGERTAIRLIGFPLIVMAVVWGLFGQLLSIRLPAGLWL